MMKKLIYVCALLLLAVAGAWAGDFNPPNPPDPSAKFKLTVMVSPSEAGYASGGGRFQEGSTPWVYTSKTENYEFQYWRCNDEIISYNASFGYTMPDSAVTLVAVYHYNPVSPADPTVMNMYRLYVENNLEGSCTFNIANGTKRQAGNSVYVRAQNISPGYQFDGWYVGEEKVSDYTSFYYTMPYQNTTLTAHFTFNPDSPNDPLSDQTDIDNSEYLLGDVNGDGSVSVIDVISTINYILQEPPEKFDEKAADVSGDGEISVVDVIGIIDIILNQN